MGQHLSRGRSVIGWSKQLRWMLARRQVMLFGPRENGQGQAEYALILALVVLVVIIILVVLGPAVGNLYSNIVTRAPF